MINIRDPLYGDIRLTDEESELLDTFEMQRLTRVKQLGLKYLVYPGATHTRFEHSLGVRHLAELVLHRSGLFDKFSKEERRIFYLAALLHDVSRPCFSHELEGIKLSFPNHENIRESILQGEIKDILIETGIFSEGDIQRAGIRFIGDVLKEKTVEALFEFFGDNGPILKDLLDNHIDVDNLDYLKRDPYYLGFPSANYDDRIYSAFRITEDRDGNRVLSFSNDDTSLEAINAVLHARYYLYKIAYLHHTVLIADSMLYDAVEGFHAARKGTMDLPFITGDSEYLEYLRKGITMRGGNEISSTSAVKKYINRLLSRNLFKRAFVLDNSNFYARRKVEQMMNDPDLKMKFLDVFGEGDEVELIFLRKESHWKPFGDILVGEKDPEPLEHIMTQELGILKDNYESLWKFIAATGKEDYPTRKKIYDICRQFFKTEGRFTPEPSVVPEKREEPGIDSIIHRIRQERQAVLKILKEVSGDNPISSEEIAENVGISRSTVSQYMNYLIRLFDSYGKEELQISKKGRKKFWWIKNKNSRKYINEVNRWS